MKLFNKDLSQEIVVIAEIGVNHEGDFLKACKLVELAVETGVDCVKFQSYTSEKFISKNNLERLERVKKFALEEKQYEQLSHLLKKKNVAFMSTPVTEDWVEKLNPFCSSFKVASGDITFKPVIKKIVATGKPIILSTGAASIEEIDQAVEWVKEAVGVNQLRERLILLHCVAAYPAPLEEANILSIPFLKERYGVEVGYSNHVIGMEASLAAVAVGASVVELHFTDQKEGREFRDHALSFDANDLKTFIQMAKKIRKSLGRFSKVVQSSEASTIDIIRKGIVAARDLHAGTVLKEIDLMYARPATEFKAIEIHKLIGKTLKQTVAEGFLIPREAVEQ